METKMIVRKPSIVGVSNISQASSVTQGDALSPEAFGKHESHTAWMLLDKRLRCAVSLC